MYKRQDLLTLADGDVDGILVEDGVLWHWGSAGFGYETNASSWAWRVSSGEIVNDVSIDGAYGFAAYDNGLVYGNTSDDEETKHLLEDKEMGCSFIHIEPMDCRTRRRCSEPMVW